MPSKLSPTRNVEQLAIREASLSLNVNPFHPESANDLIVLHVFRPKCLESQRPSHLIRTDADLDDLRKCPAAKHGADNDHETQ
jgi:hypothetical protein